MTAFCTILTDDYIKGFHALIRSLQYHNKGFNYPFYIFKDKDLTRRDELKEIYNNIRFIDYKNIDFYDLFIKTNGTIKEKFRKCLYTLDVYNIDCNEKIIFIDSDMLCNGDVGKIINIPDELGFSYATNAEEVHEPNNIFIYDFEWKKKTRHARFNAGLFVIPSKTNYLKKIKRFMINNNKGSFTLPEQKIMNKFFNGYDCWHIDRTYNALKRYFHDNWYNDDIVKKCKFIHYVGAKPWKWSEETGYTKINKLWLDFYKKECK